MNAQVTTSFSRVLSPAHLLTGDIVVGGTGLLEEFIALASAQVGQRDLILASPFLDDTSIHALGRQFANRCVATTVHLLTTPSATSMRSASALGDYPWRNWEVRGYRHLHAKIYASVPARGAPVVLIGSHNFTCAGRMTNWEAGVLMIARTPEMQFVVDGILAHAHDLRLKSELIHDSLGLELATSAAS